MIVMSSRGELFYTETPLSSSSVEPPSPELVTDNISNLFLDYCDGQVNV